MSIIAPVSSSFPPGGSPRVSFEVFPARSTMQSDGMAELAGVMRRYKPLFASVTYGAGGSSHQASFGTVGQLLGFEGLDVVGHLTCAGQSKAQTDAVIERYAAQGVKGILALRGDTPGIAGVYQPHPEGYENAAELARSVAARGGLDTYVAAYPEVHPDSGSMRACLANLKKKLATGAKAAITQFFFDNRDYFRFLEQVRATGIHQPVVPGILLVHDYARVANFARKCGARIPDQFHAAFEGLAAHSSQHKARACELAAQQIMQLAAQGIDHVHIYTMNRPDLVDQTCKLAGIGQPIRIGAAL